MSDRVKRHRQKIADQGLKVVELTLPKELVHHFQILADYYHTHRSEFMSKFMIEACSDISFKSHVMACLITDTSKQNFSHDKHKAEFTDYTLM